MNTYDIGDLIRLWIEYRNADTKALVDPTEITLLILQPDGVELSYTLSGQEIVRASDGRYSYVFNTTGRPSGLYRWRWVSTGQGQAGESGSFILRDNPFSL